MYKYLIFILFFYNVFIGFSIYKKHYKKYGFLSPIIYLYLTFFLNYPLRSITLLVNNNSFWIERSLISEINILKALFYATAFFSILYVCYNSFNKKFLIKYAYKDLSNNFIFLLIVPYILTTFYKYYSGYGFTLGTDNLMKEFHRDDIWLSINYFLHEFRFLFIFSFLFYLRINKTIPKENIISSAFVIIIYFLHSIISTAKGDFLNLFFILAIIANLFNRQVKLKYVLGFVGFAGIFVIYSSLMRYNRFAVGSFSFNTFIESVESLIRNTDQDAIKQTQNHFSILERFNYLDGLIQLQNTKFDKGIYPLGSISDFAGIFPSFLWPDKPYFNFNVFLSQNVWNWPVFLEIPIGRIGESFFTFSHLGIFMAIIYGILFKYIFLRMYVYGNPLQLILYLSILFTYIIPDAFLVYNYRSLMYLLIFYFIYKLKIE